MFKLILLKKFPLNRGYTYFGFVLLILCTYFRENILLEINALLAFKAGDRSYSYWFVSFFKSLPIKQLVYWKWGVTLFFSFIMSIITILSLYNWFKDLSSFKILTLIYLSSFGLLVIISGVAVLFNSFESVYFLLRKVLGIVQSPLPFFCFFLLLYKKKTN
jgi:hypothetical protein